MDQAAPVTKLATLTTESFPARLQSDAPSPEVLNPGGSDSVERPWPVTAVCILEFILAGFMALLFLALSVEIGGPSLLLLGIGGVLVGAQVTCAIGIWRMRRWGLYAYAALHGLMLIFNVVTGNFSPFQLIMPAVTLAVGSYNSIDMD